jgi:uncharacterized damage-inducible protein DinB
MDLLDRLLGHDAWTTRELLARAARLPEAELDRPFDLGLRTLRATFDHLIHNMEVWGGLMAGVEVRPRGPADPAPAETTVDGLLARLEPAAARLAEVARGVARRGAWDETWLDVLDDPPTRRTYGGAIAHVLTHSMHHRAQVIAMLRHLGVEDVPEGDVLGWEARFRP